MTNKLEERIELEDLWNWEVGLKEDILTKYVAQIHQEAIEDCLKIVDKVAIWPEPQPGAGQEIGALFGAGMYQQYDSDREKHEQQIKEIKNKLEKLKDKI